MEADIKPYRDEGSVEVLSMNLTGAKYTLAVNRLAADGGVKSFADIANHREQLEGIRLLLDETIARRAPDFMNEGAKPEHGRRERRSIWVSSGLNDYLNFPGVGQVFTIRCETREVKSGKRRCETQGVRRGVRICEIHGIAPARRSQKSSKQLLSTAQRRAMMALAPSTVQRIPACLRRAPTMFLQPPSTTPLATHKPIARNFG